MEEVSEATVATEEATEEAITMAMAPEVTVVTEATEVTEATITVTIMATIMATAEEAIATMGKL
jgi:hypothetical protein